MKHVMTAFMARLLPLLGQCKRCTRTSMIAAIGAWGFALVALIVLRRLEIAMGAALLAIGLTALWIAHLAALASRGTLASMLREFGAEPEEAKAIIAALSLPMSSGGRDVGRLKEGEELGVQRASRPGKPGYRLTRVVIANAEGVIAAVALSDTGSYAALDPRSVEHHA